MSDSDDDVPLAAKAGVKKASGKGQGDVHEHTKNKPAVKQEVVKAAAPKKMKTAADGKSDAAPVRVKKEYALPGQTRETPPENDSLRKFYISLLKQRPDSEMAKKWCVQHGLLSQEEAEKWLEQNKKTAGAKSPTKTVPPRRKAADETGKKRPRAKLSIKDSGTSSKKMSAAKQKTAKGESEDEWSDDEVVPQKKKRAAPLAANGVATPKPPLIPRKQPQHSAKKRDVAFADGGLGSDSEDDKPLMARKPAAQ